MTSSPGATPPRLARFLVRAASHRGDRRFLIEDLEEEFRRIANQRGSRDAARWYWDQALSSLLPLTRERLRSATRRAGRPHVSAGPLLSDFAQSIRWLRRHPGTAAVVIGTLGIAFGTVLAAFMVINAVLLRPLPFASPARIVNIWATGPTISREARAASRPNFADWREQARTFAAISAYSTLDYRLTGRGEPRRVDGLRVAAAFDSVLGVRPLLGRLFQPGDFAPGSAPVVVLTHAFWQSEFAGNTSVLQQSLQLDGRAHEVVGVLPDLDVTYPLDSHQFWLPLIPREGAFWEHARGTGWLSVVGRVRDDRSIGAAQAELSAIMSALAEQYPDVNGGRTEAVLTPVTIEITGPLAPMLRLLGAALLAVLLVACGNIGNLLLVSMARRAREFAVRAAIGADGVRLTVQVFGETMLMCAVASVAGVLLAPLFVRGFISVYPGRLPREIPAAIDATILSAAAFVAIAAAVVLSIPSAITARRTNITGTLASSSRAAGAGGTRRDFLLRGVMVTSQVALSFVLIAGGTAFVRTLERLHRVDPGYHPQGVLTFTVAPSPAQSTGAAALQFYESAVAAIREIPGVRTAAAAVGAPMTTSGWRFGIRPSGAAADVLVTVNLTTPEYFEALGIRVLQGRLLNDAEQRRGQSAAIINEPLSRLLGGDMVGKRFNYSDVAWQIVGVVEGVRHGHPRDEPRPELFIPWHLAGRRPQSIVVRADGDPLTLLPAIAARIHAIDPTAPLSDIARLEDRLRDGVAEERFRATLLAALAAIGVALAALGAYTVTAYAVAQRTREYGIRLALGETPASIGRRALASALVPSLVGILAGCGIALSTARWIESFLYQVKATEALTLGGAAATLILLSIGAGMSSARRASRIHPAVTLAAE